MTDASWILKKVSSEVMLPQATKRLLCVLKIIIGIRVVLFGLDPIISSLCLIIILGQLGAEPVAQPSNL